MKKVQLILNRESWEELRDMKNSLNIPDFMKSKELETYEEYLEEEKKNPTMALFG